jgi:hypothetical protein
VPPRRVSDQVTLGTELQETRGPPLLTSDDPDDRSSVARHDRTHLH